MRFARRNIKFDQIQTAVLIVGNILLYMAYGDYFLCVGFSVLLVFALNVVPWTYGKYLPQRGVHWMERVVLEVVNENKEPEDIETQDWQDYPNFINAMNKLFETDPIARSLNEKLKRIMAGDKDVVIDEEGKEALTRSIMLTEEVKKRAQERGIHLDDRVEVDLFTARRLDSPNPTQPILAGILKTDLNRTIYDYLTEPEGIIIKTRKMRGPHAYRAKFGILEEQTPANLSFETPRGTIDCSEAYIIIPPEPYPIKDEALTAIKANAFGLSMFRFGILGLLEENWADQNRFTQAAGERKEVTALKGQLAETNSFVTRLTKAVLASRGLDVDEILDQVRIPIPERRLAFLTPTFVVIALCALLGALLGGLEGVYHYFGYTQMETAVAGGIIGALIGWGLTKVLEVGR